MKFEFFKSLVVIFGASALVVFLLHRLKIPSIVGFLVALSSTAIVLKAAPSVSAWMTARHMVKKILRARRISDKFLVARYHR